MSDRPRTQSSGNQLQNENIEIRTPGRRGRPRVESQNETAVERRRRQIRVAQRAYRERKENTIASLQDQNIKLTNIVDQMNRLFAQYRDSAIADGMLNLHPMLSDLLLQTAGIMKDLNNAATITDDDDLAEPANPEMVLGDVALSHGNVIIPSQFNVHSQFLNPTNAEIDSRQLLFSHGNPAAPVRFMNPGSDSRRPSLSHGNAFNAARPTNSRSNSGTLSQSQGSQLTSPQVVRRSQVAQSMNSGTRSGRPSLSQKNSINITTSMNTVPDSRRSSYSQVSPMTSQHIKLHSQLAGPIHSRTNSEQSLAPKDIMVNSFQPMNPGLGSARPSLSHGLAIASFQPTNDGMDSVRTSVSQNNPITPLEAHPSHLAEPAILGTGNDVANATMDMMGYDFAFSNRRPVTLQDLEEDPPKEWINPFDLNNGSGDFS